MSEPIRWGDVATFACVRAGGDLQVVVNRQRIADERYQPIAGERERYAVIAFDGDSNPVMQMGVFLDLPTALAMLPTCVHLAREARGPGAMPDFDMVRWTYVDEDTGAVEWAGGRLDDSLCDMIGEPYT